VDLREDDLREAGGNIDDIIRDRNAEKRLNLIVPAHLITHSYELLMIINSVLGAYDNRIRELDVEKTGIEEIRKLRDIVERSLDELDSYSLIRADPYRTVFRVAAKNRRLFQLERIVRRKMRYLDTLISRRIEEEKEKEEKERVRRDWIIGILLSLLGAYQVIEVMKGMPMLWKIALLIPPLIIIGLVIFFMREEISFLLRKIKGSSSRKSGKNPESSS
jgi:hypothetical protein